MTRSSYPDRHFIVGIIILAVGAILLLDQLGLSQVTKFWPLILIYFGVNKLTTRQDMNGRFWGGFLTLLGIAFQLQELGYSRIRFETVWPVFLICIGVLLLLRRYEGRHWPGYYGPPSPPPPSAGPPSPGAPTSDPAVGESTAASPPQPEPAASPFPPSAAGPQQAGPGTQAPPPQSNFGPNWGSGSNAWNDRFSRKFQRRMERFDERMNRFNQRMNEDWQRRSSRSERQPWQSNSNWYDSSEPRLNDVNVFWGTRRRIISKNFIGGEIVAIFGGFEIDLTQADFQDSQIFIEVVTIFGGGEIRVPANWEVVVDSVGIFGGTGDRTNHPASQDSSGSTAPSVKRLIIKGVSIFGGLTLKN